MCQLMMYIILQAIDKAKGFYIVFSISGFDLLVPV